MGNIVVEPKFLHQGCFKFLASNWILKIIISIINKHICLTFFNNAFRHLTASFTVIHYPMDAIIMLILQKGNIMSNFNLTNMWNHSLEWIFKLILILSFVFFLLITIWHLLIQTSLKWILLYSMNHLII